MSTIAQSTLQGQCAFFCKINSRILTCSSKQQSRKHRQCATFRHSFLHSNNHSTPFLNPIRRKSPPFAAAIPSNTNEDIASDDQDKEAALTKAILLAYYASRSKSLFASRCIVEALIEAYQSGYTISDINLSIALSGMTSNLSNFSQNQNDELLPPIEGDILRSWVALIMVTLQTIGLELSPEGYARRAAKQCEDSVMGNADPDTAVGIQNFVDHALGKFTDEGVTLQKMLLQQSLGGMGQTIEGDAEAMVGNPSPAVAILQGQTRLILLTLEMIASAPEGGFRAALFQSIPELAVDKDSPWTAVGYMNAFSGTTASSSSSSSSSSTTTSTSSSTKKWQRGTSVKLLISFMGAVQGLLFPALEFVDTAIAAYKGGMTADDVVGQLSRSEINQTGGVVPIGVQQLPGPAISAALFSQWVSLTYITLAQLGTEHPLSRSELGWAWASPVVLASVESIDEEDADQVAGRAESFSASALEAHGVADFVAGALRQARNEEEEEEDWMGEGRAVEGAKQEGNEKDGFLMRIEDPNLSMTSPTAMIIGQQLGLVRMVMQRVSSV
jgi:hypothetical protein